jgi:DNA repair protein RadC
VLGFQEIFRGTIDVVTVHPREVVRDALACNASCVILVRSDPSGDAIFSDADAMIWRQVSRALDLVDIAALDYMLVGARVVSCAEEGWINTKVEIQIGLPATFGADAMNHWIIRGRRESHPFKKY